MLNSKCICYKVKRVICQRGKTYSALRRRDPSSFKKKSDAEIAQYTPANKIVQ